jgi:hypothetical protein
MDEMPWQWSHRADKRACILADRHYNRQKPGTPQFVPPGRCCVLYAENLAGRAFWVTSWPFAQYVKHAWAGDWVCSAFRNEGAGQASSLITSAVAASISFFGPSPGLITFIDRKKVKPTMVRGTATWGWTYLRAGFHEVGQTKGGLLAFRLSPEDMPSARPALMPLEVS